MQPWFLFTVSCEVFFFPLTARLPNQDVSGHLGAAHTQILSLILHAQSMHNRTQNFVSGGSIHLFEILEKMYGSGQGQTRTKMKKKKKKQTQYSLVLSVCNMDPLLI